MKNIKKLIAVIAAVGVLGATGAVYAADLKTPADIVSGLTGKSVEALTEERATGKTYGTIAKDADKLEEFQAQMLEQKKAILDQRVKDGKLTQAQADEIYKAIKDNQATCDGTGSAGIGKKYGAGFGQGNGMGKGQGSCTGTGMGGNGQGRGMGTGRGMMNR
jgi:hypothetical protein